MFGVSDFQYFRIGFDPFNTVSGIRGNPGGPFKPRRLWSEGDVLLAGALPSKGEKRPVIR